MIIKKYFRFNEVESIKYLVPYTERTNNKVFLHKLSINYTIYMLIAHINFDCFLSYINKFELEKRVDIVIGTHRFVICVDTAFVVFKLLLNLIVRWITEHIKVCKVVILVDLYDVFFSSEHFLINLMCWFIYFTIDHV